MATYKYYCPSCDAHFELVRPMTEDVSTIPCDTCKTECKQVITSVKFDSYFKGSYKAENEGLPING